MDSGQMITAVAGATALTAAVSDVRHRRIPNAVTYSAMLAGLVLQSILHGPKGLLISLAGGLIFGGAFLVFYFIRAMGAGDVKLAAALGFIVGAADSVPVMFATAIAGGVLALGFMIASRKTGETLRSTVAVVNFHLHHGLETHPVVNLDNPKAVRMPYGLAFAAGTLYWIVSSLWR